MFNYLNERAVRIVVSEHNKHRTSHKTGTHHAHIELHVGSDHNSSPQLIMNGIDETRYNIGGVQMRHYW